jgi:anti-sigma-K factor RskA
MAEIKKRGRRESHAVESPFGFWAPAAVAAAVVVVVVVVLEVLDANYWLSKL